MDIMTVMGVIAALAAILVGQHLEGGHLSSLVNGPAILIVFGGTLGAVMVQTPLRVFFRALQMARWMVQPPVNPVQETIEKIVAWSNASRKEGLLGLEPLVEEETDPFTRKGLQLLVDGSEPESIRSTLEVDLNSKEHLDFSAAKVFEGLGGYAPTVGIIGAVMGLIHVMGNLADPSKLGGGIAVAFVATIYGVGLSNLFFLPTANKLKNIVTEQSQFREMLIEGLAAIAEGENPRNIETRLAGYVL
ncbi:MAG: chemotaxis protein MotA [Gammaproteobacteria bacterium]|jgi:chemotaxis protein MotA